MAALRARNTHVVLITGGVLPIVRPAAQELDIPASDVFGIDLFFNEDGSFQDFDRKAFTTRPLGKALAVKHLRESRGFGKIVIVGDGVTDVEAGAETDLMVGFGGNVVRPKVQATCDWWVTEIEELHKALRDHPRS